MSQHTKYVVVRHTSLSIGENGCVVALEGLVKHGLHHLTVHSGLTAVVQNLAEFERPIYCKASDEIESKSTYHSRIRGDWEVWENHTIISISKHRVRMRSPSRLLLT